MRTQTNSQNTTISDFDLNVNSTKTVLQATTSKLEIKTGPSTHKTVHLPEQSSAYVRNTDVEELLVFSLFLAISHFT